MKKSRFKLINQQFGLVSVTVTIVIMIIVTLVVSSFALMVRREQKRALNRQLNTQAFSAAEAGINDAFSAINDANNPLTDDINDCTGADSFVEKINALTSSNYKSSLESTDNIKYSCVLINQNTIDDYNNQVSYKDGSFLVPIHTDEGITSLRLSWEGSVTPDDYKPARDYSLPATLNAPMLRVTLFKGFPPDTASELATPLSRNDLKDSAHTMFLSPNNGAENNAGAIDYSIGADQTRASQGSFVDGQCNANNDGKIIYSKLAEYDCNVDVNNVGGGEDYYLVVKPLYKDVKFNLKAFNGSSTLFLRGAQVEIEATGKAADILQRVSVRLPVGNNETTKLAGLEGIIPDSALSTSQSICKLWEVKGITNNPVDNCLNKGGKGDAGFDQDKCGIDPNPDCDKPYEGEDLNAEDTRRLERWVVVISDNQEGTIESCTWSWGDGSITDKPANECTKGSTASHRYFPENPPTDWTTKCYAFEATLTIRFNNGFASETNHQTLQVPIKMKNPPEPKYNPC